MKYISVNLILTFIKYIKLEIKRSLNEKLNEFVNYNRIK